MEKGVEAEIKRVVGTRINIAHLAATPLGEEVRVHARLTEVDGRRLVFKLDASDAVPPIATGGILVDIPRFLAKTVRTG